MDMNNKRVKINLRMLGVLGMLNLMHNNPVMAKVRKSEWKPTFTEEERLALDNATSRKEKRRLVEEFRAKHIKERNEGK